MLNKKWSIVLNKSAMMLKKAERYFEVGWKYVPPETSDPKYLFDKAPGGHGYKCKWCDFTTQENQPKEIEQHALEVHEVQYFVWKNAQQKEGAEQRIYDFYFFESVNPDLLRNSIRYGKGFAQGEDVGGVESSASVDVWERIIENLKQAKRDLITSIGDTYIDDLRYSVSCEMRHLWNTKWGTVAVSLNNEWLDDSNSWLKNRIRTAEAIEVAEHPLPDDQESEIGTTRNAIEKIKSIKLSVLPAQTAQNLKEQLEALEIHLKKLTGGTLEIKSQNEALGQYLKSLIQRFVVKNEHSWKISKAGQEDEETDEETKWTEWKKDQLGLMARFIIGATADEWKVIEQKARKFKELLDKSSGSKFKTGDWRDRRYRSSGHESAQYYQSYLKGYEAGFTNREIFLFATAGLLDVSWNGSFGGPPWAHIASMANRIDELFRGINKDSGILGDRSRTTSIDQAHNLQHNNGSAFTKPSMIYGHGGFFEQALNFKASATTTISDLLKKTSPQLYEIGQFYIYNTGFNPAVDSVDRVKEFSKILLEKSKQASLCDYLMNTDFNKFPSAMSPAEQKDLTNLQNIPDMDILKKMYSIKSEKDIHSKKLYTDLYKQVEPYVKKNPIHWENQVNRLRKLEEKSKVSPLRDLMWAQPVDYECLAKNRYLTANGRSYFLHALSMINEYSANGALDMLSIKTAFYRYQNFETNEILDIVEDFEKTVPVDSKELAETGLSPAGGWENFTQEPDEEFEKRLWPYHYMNKPSGENISDEENNHKSSRQFRYIYKFAGEWDFVPNAAKAQKMFSHQLDQARILVGLSQNKNLTLDVYFRIFDIAKNNEVYDAILGLAKNPAIKKSKDPHAQSLKEILENFDFPKEFIDKKFPGEAAYIEEDWTESIKPFDVEQISEFIGALGDIVSATTSAILYTDIQEYEKNGKKYTLVLGDFLIKDIKVASIEVRETSDVCKLTVFGDEWKEHRFLQLSDQGTAIEFVLDTLKKIEEGKPVTIGTGSKLPLVNAKLLLTSETKDLMDQIMKKSVNFIKGDKNFVTADYKLTSYTMLEDQTDIKTAQYVIYVPNEVNVTFDNQDEFLLATLESLLSDDKFQQKIPVTNSTLAVNETSLVFFDAVKTLNITNLKNIANALVSKIKIKSKFKLNLDFNFPAWRVTNQAGDLFFSGNLNSSVVTIQKKNGTTKQFLDANIEAMADFILEGIPTIADSSKNVEQIINSIAKEISKKTPVSVKKESDEKYRILTASGSELAKFIFIHEQEQLHVKIYIVNGITSDTFNELFPLNDPNLPHSAIIENIVNAVYFTVPAVKTPIPAVSEPPVMPKIPSLEYGSLPILVANEVVDYLKENFQDDNIDSHEISGVGDEKAYEIFTKDEKSYNIVLLTIKFTDDDISVIIHGYEGHLKATQEATFPKSYTKNEVVKTIVTFLSSYVTYTPKPDYKKNKIQEPGLDVSGVPDVSNVHSFYSQNPSCSPVVWGSKPGDPWINFLKFMDLVLTGLNQLSGVTVETEQHIKLGVLTFKVNYSAIVVGKINAYKGLLSVQIDDMNGYQVAIAHPAGQATDIINHFKSLTV